MTNTTVTQGQETFLDLPHDLQAEISSQLFGRLHDILVDNKSESIPSLRQEMSEKYGMSVFLFQEHLEMMYNQQDILLQDELTGQLVSANMHLTAIPITFFPDHDIEEDVIIQSTLGSKNANWAQEIAQTAINHGFLRGVDKHYVIPALFDIADLFKTPESAFQIIGDIVTSNLAQKYPQKNIVLTKNQPCKTVFFIMATALDDPESKRAIIPDPKGAFSDFMDMRLTMESILNHYYTTYSRNEFNGTIIVGPPTQGSVGGRLVYPSNMMGHLNYNLLKISHALELDKTSVVIERNKNESSYMINVYCYNRCLLSYKYPETMLAKGLEEELFTYILDTNKFSNHRFVNVDKHVEIHEKIKENMLRVVK